MALDAPTNSLKSKLDDPAFIPRIRGESSRVQIPPPATSGRNAYQMQKETSQPGSVSAAYSKRQIYNIHPYHEFDSGHSYSSEEESALKDKHQNEDEDELEVRFKQLDIKSTFSNPAYSIDREWPSLNQLGELDANVSGDPTVPRDKNGLERKCKETSLPGSVSAGYSKRQLCNSHHYHEVYYKYEDKVEYDYTVLREDQDNIW